MADKKQAVEQTAPVEDLNEMMKVRRDKLETYRSMGIAPFGHRYEVTYHAQDVRDEFSGVEDEEEHGNVRLAGRLMAIRGHGKASFATLNDRSGSIQVYFKLDVLGEEKYAQFRMLDIGDIIGIQGCVFKTRRGELTVKIQDFLWKDGEPLNFDAANIPRSQDLAPIYRETSGVYVFTKEVFEKYHRRIGKNPFVKEVSFKEAVDINNPEDFALAEALLHIDI